MVINPLFFAASLYKKLAAAEAGVREQVKAFLRAIPTTGAIPLGVRRDAAGNLEYCWLVYDRHLISPADLDRHLRDHTPPGLKQVVLYL